MVKVLGVAKSAYHVSLAVAAPKLCVVTAVYIPPTQVGYSAMGYSKMWEVIVESVRTLQIQHQVPVMSQVLMGDFNAHIGTNKAGTVPDHILLERRNADY